MKLQYGKVNNLPILAVFAMVMSGILSAVIVLMDTTKPSCYQMLWILPLMFCFNCTFIYTYRKLLFTRVSITVITGYYWIRMVATPVVMVLGDYAVVPENRSWYACMDEAIILICYESLVIFALLFILAKKLNCPNNNVFAQGDIKRIHHSPQFCSVFGLVCLFFFGMFLRWPVLIRNQFIPIFGAPPGWTIPTVEQRSLNGSGNGPLGIFVTLLCHLIFMMQLILPPIALTKILNKKGKWTDVQILFSSFVLIGFVFLIATENRSYSVYAAITLFFTLMSYSNEKQLRLESLALVFLVFAAAGAIWVKQGSNGGNELSSLSKLITAYFAGPQNVAACIQAARDNGGPDISRITYDAVRHIPYVDTVFKHFIDIATMPSCDHLFHYALYGVKEGRAWDQVVPAIGQGYLLSGFLFAPLNPAISVGISLWLEQKARKAETPVLKNVCYAGATLSAGGVSFSLGHSLSFLWYICFAAVIIFPVYTKWRREWKNDRKLRKASS